MQNIGADRFQRLNSSVELRSAELINAFENSNLNSSVHVEGEPKGEGAGEAELQKGTGRGIQRILIKTANKDAKIPIRIALSFPNQCTSTVCTGEV